MGIANRDKDASEQQYVLEQKLGAVATGVTTILGMVASAGQVLEYKVTGLGLSGTPTYALDILRWTSAGSTVITLATVTLPVAFGVSGALNIGATFASNSSLAAVQNGDLLLVRSGAANTAVTHLAVSAVIKATQDIKKTFSI